MLIGDSIKLMVFLLAEIMDLYINAWGIVRQYMGLIDWGKACGTSRASYAMKHNVVLAFLPSERPVWGLEGLVERVCMEQLQLDRWPKCYFLCFNLQRLPKGTELSQSQINKIKKASEALPLLQGLHIISRDYPYLATESSFEAVLINSLARHASVLTLKALPKMITLPFDLPTLQHLVLEMAAISTTPFCFGEDNGPMHRNPFKAIRGLKNLKTLYIHYYRSPACCKQKIAGLVNLFACVHLQHVTLRNVIFMGQLVLTACMRLQHITLHDVSFKGNLVLPEGCPLNVTNERRCLSNDIGNVAELVTGLTLHSATDWELQTRGCTPDTNWLLQHAPHMQNLKSLRVNLREKDVSDLYTYRKREEVHLIIESVPSLEVLELQMQCNLFISLDFAHALTSLVVIATGTLRLAHKARVYARTNLEADVPSVGQCLSVQPRGPGSNMGTFRAFGKGTAHRPH